MKNKTNRNTVIFCVAVYTLAYVIALASNNFIVITLLKPIATLLAYYSLSRFADMNESFKNAKKTICNAFFLWFIIDCVAAIGETSLYLNHYKLDSFHFIEMLLYAVVRIMILISAIQLYYALTSKFNRFQRIADIFTVVCCVISALWIIYFGVNPIAKTHLIWSLDLSEIFSEIYKLLSMLILGIFLISWFHFQVRAMTIGQRLAFLGLTLAIATDLALSLNNSLINETVVVEISYKTALFLIILGSLMFKKYPYRIKVTSKIGTPNKSYGTWKNAIYLLSYPLFDFCFIGISASLVLFVFIITFYVMTCLYVNQIEIIDKLLKSEKEHNEQLRLYSSVVEQAPLSVVITDMDGNIQYVNPYFTKVTGYSFDEVLGKNPRILKSEKTKVDTFTALWSNLVNGDKWVGEFINLDKYGNEYEESAVIVPIRSHDGNIRNYVALKENISEEKLIQRKFDYQNHFITQLVDNIPSAIFYVSSDDVFLGANAEFERIYGFDKHAYIGTKFKDTPWMTDKKHSIFVEMRNEALSSNSLVTRQIVRKVNGQNEAPILYSVNPFYLPDRSVSGFLGIMTDISELKQKERDLKYALKQANTATETKSEFLANMSHEIRTPMNAIIGMSYLALKTDLDIKQRDYVQKIHSAATLLLDIINDILDFSKIESGKMELEEIEFDLDLVVTNSINLLVQKAHEKQLEFLYHLPVDIPRYLGGDSLRLGQIITNLVSNAVKFTHKGEIGINISEESRSGNRICLKFSVRDTGIGIKSDAQEILFEAFTQSDNSTTRQFGGTGLGLTICRKLVEMMDGHIWVESEYGKGSNFIFTAWFTIKDEENIKEKLVARNIHGMKMLVADDNSTAREILVEYLESMGFKADGVSRGEDALQLIIKNDKDDPYDIVFIDWQMPAMDGIQTVRELYNLDTISNIPSVVLVTAYDKNEMMQFAENLKVDNYLSKPISQSTLYDTIVSLETPNKENHISSLTLFEDDYHLAGLKVLLAEDNEINQQIAIELLNGQGIEVDIANNGREAVDRISSDSSKYDLILMDLQMPKMDGFEATRQIREILKDIPIIAMTARAMAEEKDNCYKNGMNGHIAKPINPDSLFTTIKKSINPERILELHSSQAIRENDTLPGNTELKIPGIDTKAGLVRVSGNMKLYIKLVRNFAINHADTADEIYNSLKRGDYSSVEKIAHMLRGVSGNIGAGTIQYVCTMIEKIAATSKNTSEINKLTAQLKKELGAVTKSILEKNNMEEIDSNNIVQSDENIIRQTSKLLSLLEDGDGDAVDQFDSLKNELKKKLDNKDFMVIDSMIRNYEFEEAYEKLKEILNQQGVGNNV